MKNLTKNEYKNIESKVSGDLIFKDKNMLKNDETITKTS